MIQIKMTHHCYNSQLESEEGSHSPGKFYQYTILVTFQKLNISTPFIKPYSDLLIGFADKQLFDLLTTFDTNTTYQTLTI